MKKFILALLLLTISLTYANEVVENQSLSSDEEEDISPELLALIEDEKLSIEDIAEEDLIIYTLNEIAKEGDVQDKSWKKCFRINKSFKIVFKRFRFSVSGCVEVIWLSQDMGVRMILTVGRLRITKTISLRNPPALCFGIPGIKLAKVCLQFYDINLGRKSGCVKLNFRFLRWGWDMRIGCFRLYHVMADADPSALYYQKFRKNSDKNKKLGLLQEDPQKTDLFKLVE